MCRHSNIVSYFLLLDVLAGPELEIVLVEYTILIYGRVRVIGGEGLEDDLQRVSLKLPPS